MQHSSTDQPGLVVAGLRGGSGKTVISLGITSAWSENGFTVSVFKKGPDYIDAGWLACAAGRPCHNLDTYLCTNFQVQNLFQKHFKDADIAVIEGNRGLFDGIDTRGKTSTAELAKLLDLPVLLVVDCTKSTRTIAALIMGCRHFDPDLNIMGIVLNRVAGKRHEQKVRESIERFCGLRVFGSIGKLSGSDFPERHMGLVTMAEHACSKQSIDAVSKVAKENIDLDALFEKCVAAANAKHRPSKISAQRDSAASRTPGVTCADIQRNNQPTIGVVKDSAFQFYYPDNIEALLEKGVQILYISPLKQQAIPKVDAIYMGGGFPETHAPELASNHEFKAALRKMADEGLPIYAECGGFIFLGTRILLDGTPYPMAQVLPVSFGLSKRPAGHGYTAVRVVNANPFYETGITIKGHEFRYSTVLDISYEPHEMAFEMERGKGIIHRRDGFVKNNVFATYTHVHAAGTPEWAESMVKAAERYKSGKTGRPG